MKSAILTCLMALIMPTFAQVNMGGGPAPVGQSFPCLTTEQRTEIFIELAEKQNELIEKGILSATPSPEEDITKFEWPLRQNSAFNDYGYHGISNYVDHDANSPNTLKDYNCGTRTYDTQNGYNHAGTDYFTWPFSWYKMDNDIVEVVAAAPGVIINKADGNFDRSCSFNTNSWNAVYIKHADNSIAWYGHLKNGSITAKNIGDSVAVGEYLGVVGSSGNSTGPHLHLEIYDSENNLIDPYEGPCNSMNNESWWNVQRGYYDSGVNALITQSGAPDFGNCPNQGNFYPETDFVGGQDIYLATYYRDQLDTQTSTYTLYQPDGVVWQTWTHNSNAPHYNASYWFWKKVLPFDKDGVWTFEVQYEGEIYSTTFNVGIVQSIEQTSFPDHIKVYPNPANDRLSIRFDETGYTNGRISFIDMLGKTVYQERMELISVNEEIVFRVNNLSPGVYMLRAELGGKIYGKKILVE